MSDFSSIRNSITSYHGQDSDRIVLKDDGKKAGQAAQSTTTSFTSEHKKFFTLFSANKATNLRIARETVATAQKIRAAIVNRYGQSGGKLFDKTFKSGSEIKVGKLKILFNSFTAAEKANCKKVLNQELTGVGKKHNPSAQQAKRNGLLQQLKIPANRLEDVMVKAVTTLSRQEVDPLDLRQQNRELDDSIKQINVQIAMLGNSQTQTLSGESVTVRDKLLGELEHLKSMMKKQLAQNTAQLDKNPLAVKNVRDGFQNVYTAALLVIAQLKNRCASKGQPVPQQVNTLEDEIRNKSNNLFVNRSDQSEISKDELKGLKKVKTDLAKQLSALSKSCRPKVMSEKELATAYKNAMGQNLNTANEWNPIRKEVVVSAFGKSATVTSEIIPAGNLSTLQASYKQDKIKGVSSLDRTNTHACNLAVSTLSVPDAKGGDKVLFQGLRHGVNSAFGIKDQTLRQQANISRTKEVFAAALQCKPELLQDALNGKTVNLSIVSSSLLTPAHFFKEKNFLAEQNAAWKNACNKDGICTLQVADAEGKLRTIRIRPKVITFNFPVNSFSHTKLGWLASFGGGFSDSKAMINQGIHDLLGDTVVEGMIDENSPVGQFLEAHRNLPQRTVDNIKRLVGQILHMNREKTYADSDYDPYALPARIMLLAHLTGMVPAYNCKSGKDRTSVLDAQVKSLAYQAEIGQLHEGHHRQDERDLTVNLLLNGGNHELQQYNTGFAGYKINSVSGLFTKIPGLAALFENKNGFKLFKGGSAGTES
ncbi:MAG: hypothetical protein K6F05_05925 [Succinivibrio sp.]|nr:hypothetical protein [Succinivibrio sp.]